MTWKRAAQFALFFLAGIVITFVLASNLRDGSVSAQTTTTRFSYLHFYGGVNIPNDVGVIDMRNGNYWVCSHAGWNESLEQNTQRAMTCTLKGRFPFEQIVEKSR